MDAVDTAPLGNPTHNQASPRILHLSTYDYQDGAARGSTWLAKALRLRGMESSLVVGRKRSDDPTVHQLPGKLAPITTALRMKFDLHDGFLAEPYSTDDLVAGIAWCLDQVKIGPPLGRRARAKVESKFDIDMVAASYERLYRRILAEGRGRV